MNNPYKFSITASEMERLILSIKEKIDKNVINNDVTTGGENKLVSAEALKTKFEDINTKTTGEGLKDAINSAEDSNVFTDAHKERLESGNYKFVGAPSTIAERDLINTDAFIGGETILLMRNQYNRPIIQFWDNDNNEWDDLGLEGRTHDVNFTVSNTTKEIERYKLVNSSMYVMRIMAKTLTNTHIMEISVTCDAGNNVYITSISSFFTDTELFTVDASYDSLYHEISVTSTSVVGQLAMQVETLSMY